MVESTDAPAAPPAPRGFSWGAFALGAVVSAVLVATQADGIAEGIAGGWERGRQNAAAEAPCALRLDGPLSAQARALGATVAADGCVAASDTGALVQAYAAAVREREQAIEGLAATVERYRGGSVVTACTAAGVGVAVDGGMFTSALLDACIDRISGALLGE